MKIAIEISPEHIPFILEMTDLHPDVVWNMLRTATETGTTKHLVIDTAPDAEDRAIEMEENRIRREYKTSYTSLLQLTERPAPRY